MTLESISKNFANQPNRLTLLTKSSPASYIIPSPFYIICFLKSLSLGLCTKQSRPGQAKTDQAVGPCRPAWPIPNPIDSSSTIFFNKRILDLWLLQSVNTNG
ncbi:hypothetical protein MTR_2g011860 [Medicago truncatula]|uniref:Uncharacterized protein n=1 Tax=Medicago truncatula TaxID=3880 RepID=A0A072V595_MEDTR|nr:hypothetical protein MTR_2g011860 [Medicago truncatula]